MCGWCPCGVQPSCDLRQALTRATLRSDLFDELRRENGPPARSRWRLGLPWSWPASLSDQSLQLVGRNQPGAPRHLDRLDKRQDAPAEGLAADAERLGSLRSRISEPLNASRLVHAGMRCLRLSLGTTRRSALLDAC